MPDIFIGKIFRNSENSTLKTIIDLRSRFVVSREVLISRLYALKSYDREGLLNTHILRDRIVGVGVWRNGDSAQLIGWPMLVNFGNNLVPEFIYKSLAGECVNLSELLSFEFGIQGGDEFSIDSEFRCGTQSNPSVESLRFHVEFESVPRRAGNSFMYVISPSA